MEAPLGSHLFLYVEWPGFGSDNLSFRCTDFIDTLFRLTVGRNKNRLVSETSGDLHISKLASRWGPALHELHRELRGTEGAQAVGGDIGVKMGLPG